MGLSTASGTDTAERLVSPQQVAEQLRMSVGALAQLRYLGRGPTFIKLGPRTVRYRQGAVEAWITASECTRTDDRPSVA